MENIYVSINNNELGKRITSRHLQASSSMIFKVFADYDPDNLLMKQAQEEVLSLQFEKSRLTESLQRINQQEIVVKKLLKPTPLCFPIMVDRLRERFTNEKLSDRIEKMQLDFD